MFGKKKKKKMVKQKKNSTYILENVLGKPIKLLILVMTHSLQDPFLDDLSFPGDLSPTKAIMLYMKIESRY